MFMLITMPRSILDRIPNLDLEMEQFYDIVTEFARFNSSYILCIKANECYAFASSEMKTTPRPTLILYWGGLVLNNTQKQ